MGIYGNTLVSLAIDLFIATEHYANSVYFSLKSFFSQLTVDNRHS